jgi:hypothetical protein
MRSAPASTPSSSAPARRWPMIRDSTPAKRTGPPCRISRGPSCSVTPELPAESFLALNPDTLQLRTHDIGEALDRLHEEKVRHLLVEGGPRILAAFFAAGVVDEVFCYQAPLLIGPGRRSVEGSTIGTLSEALRLVPDDTEVPALSTARPRLPAPLRHRDDTTGSRTARFRATPGSDGFRIDRTGPSNTRSRPTAHSHSLFSTTTSAPRRHMFTGIIEGLGTVEAIELHERFGRDHHRRRLPRRRSRARRLTGRQRRLPDLDAAGPPRQNPGRFTAEVMGETLRLTGLGHPEARETASTWNAAPPPRGASTGTSSKATSTGAASSSTASTEPDWSTLRIAVPTDLAPLTAVKGSIALNGVSLTLTAVSEPDGTDRVGRGRPHPGDPGSYDLRRAGGRRGRERRGRRAREVHRAPSLVSPRFGELVLFDAQQHSARSRS